MFKVGDEVFVTVKILEYDRIYNDYKVEFANGALGRYDDSFFNDVHGKTYTQGLADAWELAKKIVCHEEQGGMSIPCFSAIFDEYMTVEEVLASLTAEEALAKIEAYEREKEIKVGDVVVHGATETKDVFVVTSIGNGMIRGVKKNGVTNSFTFPNPYIKKTGKHIEIEGLLRQIGE